MFSRYLFKLMMMKISKFKNGIMRRYLPSLRVTVVRDFFYDNDGFCFGDRTNCEIVHPGISTTITHFCCRAVMFALLCCGLKGRGASERDMRLPYLCARVMTQ